MILVRKDSTLYFGIKSSEIDALRDGERLHFQLAELGADLQFDCYIIVGESDAAIADQLGVVPENQPAKKVD